MDRPIVYLTGGSGKLGQILQKSLIESFNVKCISFRNEEPKKNDSSITLSNFRKVLDYYGGEAVIHAATSYDNLNPVTQRLINYEYPKIILETAKNSNIKSFINFGTPLPPESSNYSLSKYEFEDLLSKTNTEFSRVTLKPHIMFGSGMSSILDQVVDALREGKNIDLTSCLQVRDFIHVEVVVDVLKNILDKIKQHNHHTLELGYEINLPMREVFIKIAQKLNADTANLKFNHILHLNQIISKLIAKNGLENISNFSQSRLINFDTALDEILFKKNFSKE